MKKRTLFTIIESFTGLGLAILACGGSIPSVPDSTSTPPGQTKSVPTSIPLKPAAVATARPTTTPPKPTAMATATPTTIHLKIMPLGDSITYGTVDLNYGGYRHLLGRLLIADGYSFDFVGSQQSGVDVIPDSNNEGHPGWTIPDIKHGIDTEHWLETYQPNLILLHIGTNDINRGNAAEAPANLSDLLDDILARSPDTRIIVAQIIHYQSGSKRDIRAYDAAIPGILASKGPRVSVVDMQNILTPRDYANGLHPNEKGYDKMARAWESAIRIAEPLASDQATPTTPSH